MAKRFTDTEKYKKAFYRKLPGAYKLFWDFICHDCDHAGIWHVDMEIAQIYIGQDMEVDIDKAIDLFNDGEIRIEIINGGSKWFIRPFIEFQYGALNPNNRVHLSIINILEKNKIKPLTSPLKGVKDKDKDKDKVKDKDKDKKIYDIFNNVKLTDEELTNLKDKFPDYTTRIEKLGEYMKSTGKKYKCHYATILTWSRKDKDKPANKHIGLKDIDYGEGVGEDGRLL